MCPVTKAGNVSVCSFTLAQGGHSRRNLLWLSVRCRSTPFLNLPVDGLRRAGCYVVILSEPSRKSRSGVHPFQSSLPFLLGRLHSTERVDLEFRRVYWDGVPIANIPYTVTLSDDSTRKGTTDGSGLGLHTSVRQARRRWSTVKTRIRQNAACRWLFMTIRKSS